MVDKGLVACVDTIICHVTLKHMQAALGYVHLNLDDGFIAPRFMPPPNTSLQASVNLTTIFLAPLNS